MTSRNSSLPFRAYYFCVYAGLALVSMYLALYFKRAGMSDTQIGWLTGAMSVLGVLSPPLWGALSDRIGSKRKPGIFLMAVTAAIFPAFFWTRTFLPAVLVMIVWSSFSAPIVPLADAATLAYLQRAGGDYGRIRVWGSIGFAFVLAVTGFFLPNRAQGPAGALLPVFLAYVGWRVIGIAAAAWCKDDASTPLGSEQKAPAHVGRALLEAARLFRRPALLLFLICGFLGWAAMQSYYVFFPIYLDALHVTDQQKGWFVAIGVVAEILFMPQAGRVRERIGTYGLLTLGLSAQALRLFLFSDRPAGWTLLAIALAQLLHAFTFAAYYIACIAMLAREVPERLRAGGQTFFIAMVMGLGGLAGAVLAARLAQSFHLAVMFRIAALVALAAALLSLLLQGLDRRALSEGRNVGAKPA